MSLNLAAPITDNATDDILVLSSNGDVNKTSKAALIAEAGGDQNLQEVLEVGSTGTVGTDISINRTVSGGTVEVTLTGTEARIKTPKRGLVANDTGEGELYLTQDNVKLKFPELEADQFSPVSISVDGGTPVFADATGNIDLNDGVPIPQDFFISAPNRSSQFTNITYVTDTLRFLNLSAIIPNFRNGKEIFRVSGTNDIIIAYTPAPTYISPIWFVKLPNCRIKDNILLFDTPITGSMPVSDLTHGSDIDDNYFYLSTRVQSANVNTLSTEIIKVNINNFSDVYSLTLPIADYKGMASELREYKESLYTLIHNPDTDITKLVKISKNFDKYETIASYGADVTNRSRIAIPFSIYNEEIIVPANNWTNTTTQYNNYVVNVFDLNGNLKRIKEVSLPGNPGVGLLSPHWMTVFNNKIIITPTGGGNALQDRYIVRIDAGLDSDNDSIVFEESKLVRTLISDDNSLFSTGYLIIGAETSSNPRPEAELIKMLYNDFTDLEVLATNYSAIAAIHPKFSTGIAKTKLSEFENDLGLGDFIPLTGTTAGNPVTGDVEMQNFGGIGIYGNDIEEGEPNGRVNSISVQASSIEIQNIDPLGVDLSRTSITVSKEAIIVNDLDELGNARRGIQGGLDYSANITEFDYTQKKYVDNAIASIPSGATNLTYTASPTNGTVNSDTGTDATIPLADTTNAGLLSPSDKTKLNNTSGTNSGDNATNTTSNNYADGKVANDMVASTSVAPSKTAVKNYIDTADALKANLSGGNSFTGTQMSADDITIGAGNYLRNGSSQNIFRLMVGSNTQAATVSNNTSNAISSFAVDNINASNTGQIIEFRSGGTMVSGVRKDGRAFGSNGTSTNDFVTVAQINSMTAYVAKTAAYTLTSSDYCVDLTANTATFTLPTAVGITGKQYIVKNSGAGVLTLATTSSQTIDGMATMTFPVQYSGARVISDGANWKVIGSF